MRGRVQGSESPAPSSKRATSVFPHDFPYGAGEPFVFPACTHVPR